MLSSSELGVKRPAPNPLCMFTDETDGFYFQRSARSAEAFRLPPDVFDRLTGGRLERCGVAWNRIYATDAEAMADLNAAAG